MGSSVRASCSCGYATEAMIGGGMMNFHNTCLFPALCGECDQLVAVNLLAQPGAPVTGCVLVPGSVDHHERGRRGGGQLAGGIERLADDDSQPHGAARSDTDVPIARLHQKHCRRIGRRDRNGIGHGVSKKPETMRPRNTIR